MAGIEEAFEKFADRLAREESKRYSRDEQGDYVEEVQDPYPIKLGPLELGANANMVTGKFSPNEYDNISTMNRNVGLRGKYNVPNSGIALLGSIGDVRSSQNVKTNLPFNPMTGEASPYSEMRKDVYKDSPYSVGAQYTPQGTDEMYSALYNKGGGYNLGYNKGPVNVSYTSNPGLGNNVMLRGQYNFADGGVASMFRKRPGYAEGETVEYDDGTDLYNQALEANIRQETEKGALAQQKFSDYLKEKTGYENIDAYYQDPGYQSYNPRAADKDITKAIYDNINLQGYKPFGYEDTPFEFGFDKDPDYFYQKEYEYDPRTGEPKLKSKTPYTSEEKQGSIKSNLESELYNQSLFDPYKFGFSNDRQPTIESSKFFLDQLQNLQGRDSDFADVIKKGNYIDLLESNLRSMYDDGEYQKLQETLDPGYSKYASDSSKINRAFDTSDVLANYDSATGKIDSSIYSYLSDAERNIIQQSQSLPTYLTGYAQQLIQDTRNRKQESDNRANAYAQQYSNLPTTQYSLSDELGFERPQIDPFSGQQISMQDQMAFTQPQVGIFPQQNIFQPPSPVDQFIGERRFQAEADAAARSGIPFTKTIQDYLGNLYSGPEIANMQEQTFGTSNLSGDTGIVSDLRHATAASQVRDKIANAVSMNYFNPAGILPQSLGLFGSQVLGAANEIQSIRPNMQSMRDIGEDLRANFYGATQVPYGQSATTTYNQLLNNPSLPSAQMRSQQEASARVTPTRMAYGGRVSMSDGGLTTMIAPAKGPDSQGVESLFRRRYN